jgi:hypothetical protein
MSTLRDPTNSGDFTDLDAASRVALAKQLEAMSEWNRAMAMYIGEYQLNVLATFRSALASKWARLWVLFATEGCLSLWVIVISLLMLLTLGLFMTMAIANR